VYVNAPLPPGLNAPSSFGKEWPSPQASPYESVIIRSCEPAYVPMPCMLADDEPVLVRCSTLLPGSGNVAPAWKSLGEPERLSACVPHGGQGHAVASPLPADIVVGHAGLAAHVGFVDGSSDFVPSGEGSPNRFVDIQEVDCVPAKGKSRKRDPISKFIQSVLSGQGAGGGTNGRADTGAMFLDGMGSSRRWWTKPGMPQLCPLTQFPIRLLPYPPFKFRVDPRWACPHRLVDGKFLALSLIVSSVVDDKFVGLQASLQSTTGRRLKASDVHQLDEYLLRCKLGPYRPGRAFALAREAASATLPERRAQAKLELTHFMTGASQELEKLRLVQKRRVLKVSKCMNDQFTCDSGGQDAQDGRTEPEKQSVGSTRSTCSTSSGSTSESGSAPRL